MEGEVPGRGRGGGGGRNERVRVQRLTTCFGLGGNGLQTTSISLYCFEKKQLILQRHRNLLF